MHNFPTKQKNNFRARKFFFALLFATFFISAMQPKSAFADLTDPFTDILLGNVGTTIQGGLGVMTTAQTYMAQQQVNDANKRVLANTAAEGAEYMPKSSYCAIAKLPQALQSAQQAKKSLEQAIESAALWAGAGANDNNANTRLWTTMCSMSLLPQGSDCKNVAYPEWSTAAFTNAVVSRGPYQLPSVLKTDSSNPNKATLSGTPQAADMPWLAAFFSCILRRPSTDLPFDSNNTNVNGSMDPTVISRKMQDLRRQALATTGSSSSARCLAKLADNTYVGQNASTPGMQAYKTALGQVCHYMAPSANGTGHMSDADDQTCEQGNGSWAQIQMALKCPDPALVGNHAKEGNDNYVRGQENAHLQGCIAQLKDDDD